MNRNKKSASLNPDELVQYFADAQTNLVTYWRAQNTADYSEKELLQALQQIGGADAYTSSSDLSTVNMDKLVKDSLNIHLSKAQAQQIESLVNQQVQTLQQQAEKSFLKKAVLVVKLADSKDVFNAIYRNVDGGFRESNYTVSNLKGRIKHIDLAQNALFVEPTWLARKLTPNREMIRVAVVNLETLQPHVKIQ